MEKQKKLLGTSIDKLKKAQIPHPELDARVIFEFALNISTEDFYKFNFVLSEAQENKINKLIARRAKGEPVAYLTGHKEFFGLDFLVNKNVLIPRPESEWLVEESIKYLVSSIKDEKLNIIDIGTGSGNIIISIIKQLNNRAMKQCDSFASDISARALKVTQTNINRHNVKLKLYKSDLFESIPKQKFDLIIANLPYVPDKVKSRKSKVESDIDFEPKMAIFARDNGTEIIKRFLEEAKDYLKSDGQILIELDPRNAEDLKKYAQKKFPLAQIELIKDLAGLKRYLTVRTMFF